MKRVSSEAVGKDIRSRTRKKYSLEVKIRIVLDGFRGEDSISNLCRRGGIPANLYYRWSKDFLEAGKKRLMGDTAREDGNSNLESGTTNRCRKSWRNWKTITWSRLKVRV